MNLLCYHLIALDFILLLLLQYERLSICNNMCIYLKGGGSLSHVFFFIITVEDEPKLSMKDLLSIKAYLL